MTFKNAKLPALFALLSIILWIFGSYTLPELPKINMSTMPFEMMQSMAYVSSLLFSLLFFQATIKYDHTTYSIYTCSVIIAVVFSECLRTESLTAFYSVLGIGGLAVLMVGVIVVSQHINNRWNSLSK